jgi:hypothetical protein
MADSGRHEVSDMRGTAGSYRDRIDGDGGDHTVRHDGAGIAPGAAPSVIREIGRKEFREFGVEDVDFRCRRTTN